jgi:cellulose synthase/poly-beta-1,6-N-acetylglucosamine synthase-like glycosyltransferase
VITAVRVVIPAHDEEQLIEGCLVALHGAASNVDVPVDVLVVLDDCSDATAAVCARLAARTVAVPWRNVGAARSFGFAGVPDRTDLWLASTDADTRVAPDWLTSQLHLADAGADAVLGVIDVDDWTAHPPEVRGAFHRLYAGTSPGAAATHRHIHGANLGVRASAYRRAGGFAPLALAEDHDLVGRLDLDPAVSVVRTTAVRATTSARRDPRASGGFGDLLASLS